MLSSSKINKKDRIVINPMYIYESLQIEKKKVLMYLKFLVNFLTSRYFTFPSKA